MNIVNEIPRLMMKIVERYLFQGKIIIIYGARQVGKTTLVKELQKNYAENSLYLNCDEIDVRQALTDKTSTELKNFLHGKKFVIIDEAQRVKNIGLTLKLIIDNFPDIQIVATGSSSFELSDKIKEPLTGRKYEFFLYPFSLQELTARYDNMEMNRLLEHHMIYGMYPEIVQNPDKAVKNLKSLASSYLYQDLLQYQNIKNPEVLEKLLQALALQIGNEVSYTELAQLVKVDKNTVANYIQILERAFIVFRVSPFSRNLRNELKKTRKIYFYDLGIRNALINNFNPLHLRHDSGYLWENLMISERIKYNQNHELSKNLYFWRTSAQQEIDLIEEYGGNLYGYEFKYKSDKFKKPKIFLETYKGSTVKLINKDNYKEFVI